MTEVFLYTFPQWIVFAALFGLVYGWVEDKKAFRLIGLACFIALGLFSLYVILGDYLAPGKFLTPEEVMSEELNDEILNEAPIEAQLLPAYLSFMGSAILAIIALLLDWLNKKYNRLFMVLAGLVALFGFFIVVGAVRSI
ncbi:hypothetical protein SLH46_17660 [Draconibacterium sp. IB214405]|uniref:hypothetical protein n=1 Tax=Draconibacterium sp. IB214405 TaxID=3097352 RepID=UPI002A158733|nr:hypothetical protein [Draconibacterium sp. IB214405]MDX8341030.1 hypothetical protein [Draconibacterium sp. IB214405]